MVEYVPVALPLSLSPRLFGVPPVHGPDNPGGPSQVPRLYPAHGDEEPAPPDDCRVEECRGGREEHDAHLREGVAASAQGEGEGALAKVGVGAAQGGQPVKGVLKLDGAPKEAGDQGTPGVEQ